MKKIFFLFLFLLFSNLVYAEGIRTTLNTPVWVYRDVYTAEGFIEVENKNPFVVQVSVGEIEDLKIKFEENNITLKPQETHKFNYIAYPKKGNSSYNIIVEYSTQEKGIIPNKSTLVSRVTFINTKRNYHFFIVVGIFLVLLSLFVYIYFFTKKKKPKETYINSL